MNIFSWSAIVFILILVIICGFLSYILSQTDDAFGIYKKKEYVRKVKYTDDNPNDYVVESYGFYGLERLFIYIILIKIFLF
jgi:hypothetical protein